MDWVRDWAVGLSAMSRSLLVGALILAPAASMGLWLLYETVSAHSMLRRMTDWHAQADLRGGQSEPHLPGGKAARIGFSCLIAACSIASMAIGVAHAWVCVDAVLSGRFASLPKSAVSGIIGPGMMCAMAAFSLRAIWGMVRDR